MPQRRNLLRSRAVVPVAPRAYIDVDNARAAVGSDAAYSIQLPSVAGNLARFDTNNPDIGGLALRVHGATRPRTIA
ncbi:hypothetical protein GCM10023067_54050 [Aminobacter aganoensis]